MEKCLVRPIKACRKRRSPLTSKFSKKFTPVTFRNHVTFSQSKNAGPPVSCSESNQLHSKVANRQYKDMSFGIIVDQKNPFPSATKSDDEVTLPLDSDDFFEMARSSLIGKQVICQEDGRILGFATQLCVDWDMVCVYYFLDPEMPLFPNHILAFNSSSYMDYLFVNFLCLVVKRFLLGKMSSRYQNFEAKEILLSQSVWFHCR